MEKCSCSLIYGKLRFILFIYFWETCEWGWGGEGELCVDERERILSKHHAQQGAQLKAPSHDP